MANNTVHVGRCPFCGRVMDLYTDYSGHEAVVRFGPHVHPSSGEFCKLGSKMAADACVISVRTAPACVTLRDRLGAIQLAPSAA